MRKKPNMPQRQEKCVSVHITKPEAYRGQWLQKMPAYQGLQLEIGCGKGKFTAETAVTQPNTLFVAVERVAGALIIAMERAVSEEIPNIRFIETDAVRLTDIFAPGEVDRIYINFCDPWPNNGHKKRRLTHEGFLTIYKEILAPGGEIHFKTDNAGLFEFSLGQFESSGFELFDVTRDLHRDGPQGVMTDYEMKFDAQGIPICRCVATARGRRPDEN